MVGAFQRHEAAGVPGGAEDLTRVGDADSVVGRRMHDEQRPSQGADSFAEIGGADVLDEISLESQCLAADEECCLAVGLDPLDQGVVVVSTWAGWYGAPMLATAATV